MNELQVSQLKDWTAKLASEIVFAESGKDNGLLPVNSLLRQIEELLAASGRAEPIAGAVDSARRWVDEMFQTTGAFSAPVLQRFNEWVGWMQNAVRALEQKSTLPPAPGHWNHIEPKPETVAVLAAPAPTGTTEEPTLIIKAELDGELLREFINESGEHLQNIEQGVLVLEENPADADTLNTIFRAFHTFKGGSGFLDLIAIQSLAHELESLLDDVRQHKLAITPGVINLILEGGDTLKHFISEIDARLSGKKDGVVLVPTLELLSRIRAVLKGEAIPSAAVPVPVPAAPAPVVASAMGVTAARTSDEVRSVAPTPPHVESSGVAKGSVSGSAIKVDTGKLDSLVDLVGELVIGQSLVVQNRALLAVQDQQLARDLAHLGRVTRELQRTAMSLRMVPIHSTFQKMNRLVRDTAARIGKQVELIIEGGETELDRTIIEQIGDPLIHMVRNAIDHGIELPAVREQRGKPTHGTVWLKAFYRGGNIVIEIKDDGNGLDKARLLAKAVANGTVRADDVLSEGEIFNLVFAAGFSLAEKVTDLSGRGVGMDVVRRNIEKLRGKVEIQSGLGYGSTFSISLPLTLAIIDGLIVGVGEHRYILPTLSVCESFRPTAGMISSVQGRGEMMSVRGRLRPVLRLYEHLGVQPVSTDPLRSIVVVVEAGVDSRCLIVDELLGKQEVVIKSLGETFNQSRAFAGAAILGDGRVGLILDPHALVELTSELATHAA